MVKVEKSVARLKRHAKRYNKSYPAEMVHANTKRLPLLKGELKTDSREYKETLEHIFVQLCRVNRINQKFTRKACPQTNGKAERVIRTLMKMIKT